MYVTQKCSNVLAFCRCKLTGKTSPRRVTSPVIAVSERTQRSVNRDTSTVDIVTPAEGPSLLIAPAGK
jgi:hypothetical protein